MSSVVVLSRRMFVETLEFVAVEEDLGNKRQLFGMFIVAPNANLGVFSCASKWGSGPRPKAGKFGQLDTLREREVEEATLMRLRAQCVVLLIDVSCKFLRASLLSRCECRNTRNYA